MLPAPLKDRPWPPGTVWAWRPALWSGEAEAAPLGMASGASLSPDLKVFCAGLPDPETPGAVGNVLNGLMASGMSSGLLRLTSTATTGAFLSLVVELPDEALAQLNERSLLRLDIRATFSGAGDLSARLNLRQTSNLAAQTRPVREVLPGCIGAEFDLAYCEVVPPFEQLWIDVIVSAPNEAVFDIADMALSARPRLDV